MATSKLNVKLKHISNGEYGLITTRHPHGEFYAVSKFTKDGEHIDDYCLSLMEVAYQYEEIGKFPWDKAECNCDGFQLLNFGHKCGR